MIFLERKQFSEEERKEHVNNWECSGMSITQYAKSCNISRKTLSTWIQKARAKTSSEIEFSPAIDISQSFSNNVVTFENETIKIELKKNFNKNFLRKIVEVLVND